MPISRPTWIQTAVFIVVLAIAASLRVIDFPSRYTIRDIDETGYCHGSLQLIEGITPGNKASPGGPLYWAGWMYVACEAVRDVIVPEKPASAMELRPFVALDRVLFKNYRDVSSLHRALVILVVAFSLAAVVAAVGLGLRLGGAVGALVLGGLFTVTPPFVDLSEMSRPYSLAWSFGIVSLFFASFSNRGGRRWWIATAVFLGLSVGSRIEMLCLIPLVWWMVWIGRRYDQAGQSPVGSVPGGDAPVLPPAKHASAAGACAFKLTLLSLCIATWISPWLMTHLLGNLRTIATVRFSGVASPRVGVALKDCLYVQGMGPVILLAIVACFFQPAGSRLRLILPAMYASLLTISMVLGYADGIHQHGPVLIAWFLLLATGIEPLLLRWPKPMCMVLAVVLLFPLARAVVQIRFNQSLEDHEDVVAWVEQHVPAGTTVYLIDGGERSLLPTSAASAALWSEVTDDQAWQKKMESGLSRFKLSTKELPRALSEENLIQERANRRKWFILGGHTDLPIPRYNIKLVAGSPVFGIHDLDAAMKSHGGVLIWRDGFPIAPPAFLGQPVMQWTSRQGSGVRVYCSPELRATIFSDALKNKTLKTYGEQPPNE
jgi:hypothetical protein